MKITSKQKVWYVAAFAGALYFIQTLAQAPPSVQDGLFGQLVALVPTTWKPNVILYTGLVKWVLSVYALVLASHSGPQTPPKNSPNS